MSESIKELLSAAQGGAKWFNDAAQFFEEFAAKLRVEEKAEWDLLASVYRERAQLIQSMTEKVRQKLTTDGPSELRLENT
jgi:hypothetical protein